MRLTTLNNDNKEPKILDFMRRNQMKRGGGEALWTAPTKKEEITK
jgi:hypothetical protein